MWRGGLRLTRRSRRARRRSRHKIVARGSRLAVEEPSSGESDLVPLNQPTERIPSELRSLSEAHLTDSGVTVLGSYRPPPGYLSYIDKAQQRGASYFDIGDAWNNLAPAQREAANIHFLDVIGDRGDKVLLSIPKSEIIPGTALHFEIRCLQESLDYRWTNQWSLRPK